MNEASEGVSALPLFTRWGRWLRTAMLICTTLLTALLVSPNFATAHPLDQASLVLLETQPGSFEVRFQSGSPALREDLKVPAVFPQRCAAEPWRVVDGAARTRLECGVGGLSGAVQFPWLQGSMMRLMVDIQWHDGSRLLRVVSASVPSLSVYGPAASGWAALSPVLVDYVALGGEHIAFGFDHLFFVIALSYLVRRRSMLLATITAFTLAHSLTLAATVLGALTVPVEPVEAMIALSIVVLCAECLAPRPGASGRTCARRGVPAKTGRQPPPASSGQVGRSSRAFPSYDSGSLTRRAPWLVAFAFGLLHGLGFASALLDVGLPERHLPSALLSFNVGVELGQLVVVALVWGLRALARRRNAVGCWMPRAVIYAMGSLAAFWSIERVVAVLTS